MVFILTGQGVMEVLSEKLFWAWIELCVHIIKYLVTYHSDENLTKSY